MAVGPNTRSVAVYLPVETKEWAERRASRQGMSLSGWLRARIISEHRRELELQQQAAR